MKKNQPEFNSTSINEILVKHLIKSQFPEWGNLRIKPVTNQGWDNRTFRLGESKLVRLPSAKDYELQVEKEYQWLTQLAPHLPLTIPQPIAIGKPSNNYPFHWSIYKWIKGESAITAKINNDNQFAKDLALFLKALQSIDSIGGTEAGWHSFYRGGSLQHYDDNTRKALSILENKIDSKKALTIWESALNTKWNKNPVWVHGDIALGNLLFNNGKLSAVIDFGQLAIGDPACDLAIAWTYFNDASRAIFLDTLMLDADTVLRGKAWTLWKAVMIASGLMESNTIEGERCWEIIDAVIE